jgi:hypothetical protein
VACRDLYVRHDGAIPPPLLHGKPPMRLQFGRDAIDKLGCIEI